MFSRFLVLITLLLSTPLFAGKKHDMCAWDCSDTDENFQKGVEDVRKRYDISDAPHLFCSMYPWTTEEESYQNMNLPTEELAKITQIMHLTAPAFSHEMIDGVSYIRAKATDVLTNANGGFLSFLNFCGFKRERKATCDDNWVSMPYVYAPGFQRGWTRMKDDFSNPELFLLFSQNALSDSEVQNISVLFSRKDNAQATNGKRKREPQQTLTKRVRRETLNEGITACGAASQVSPQLPRSAFGSSMAATTSQEEASTSVITPTKARLSSGQKPKTSWTAKYLSMDERFYIQALKAWMDAQSSSSVSEEDMATLIGDMDKECTMPHHTRQGPRPGSFADGCLNVIKATRGQAWHDVLKPMRFPLAMEFLQFCNATRSE